MQENNVLTPKERLMVAAQQMAGMQAPGYLPTTLHEHQLKADAALIAADELILQSGCIVAGQPEAASHDMD